jgi:rhodanese-related sulfurtransferase
MGCIDLLCRAIALGTLAAGVGAVHSVVGRDAPIRVTRGTPPVVPVNPPQAVDPAAGTPETPAGASTAPPAAVDPLDRAGKPGSLTLREAHALWEQGAAFLDARRQDEFDAGHIAGALWMPAARVPTTDGLADLQFLDPGATVIIYCDGGDCDASENTAIRLEGLPTPFTDVRIMGMGYSDWVAAGLPTQKPDETGSPAEAAP